MLGIQHQKGINKYFKKIHVNSQENIIQILCNNINNNIRNNNIYKGKT